VFHQSTPINALPLEPTLRYQADDKPIRGRLHQRKEQGGREESSIQDGSHVVLCYQQRPNHHDDQGDVKPIRGRLHQPGEQGGCPDAATLQEQVQGERERGCADIYIQPQLQAVTESISLCSSVLLCQQYSAILQHGSRHIYFCVSIRK